MTIKMNEPQGITEYKVGTTFVDSLTEDVYLVVQSHLETHHGFCIVNLSNGELTTEGYPTLKELYDACHDTTEVEVDIVAQVSQILGEDSY